MSERAAFFPDPVFGWVFYLVLVGITLVAAYRDWREMKIPKTLSITALALGIAFNLARGAWLGELGKPVWVLEPNGLWTGLADGLLFALAGFAVGFGLFFVLWLLKTCGGGDVKLFGALGAWVGWERAILVLMGTYLGILVIVFIGKFVLGVFSRGFKRPRAKKLAYSFWVALSVVVILFFNFYRELVPTAGTAPVGNVTRSKTNEN
jgi:Flp pilus assembly protein protease CpaA